MRANWLWPLLPWSLRERLLRRLLRFEASVLAGYRVRLAESRDELLAASRLMYAGYRETQLATEHPSGIRYSSFWLLPTTHVLVGEDREALSATLSLMLDGVLGVPMQRVLPEVVAGLRAQGRRVAEVGSLAVAPGRRRTGMAFLLYKAAYLLARDGGVDDLLIAVQPDAADLYRALLCFEPLGPPVANYPGVEGPVRCTPMRLRLRESIELFRARFDHLPHTWGNPLYLYVERQDPGITLPAASQWQAYARRRLAASTQLITTRPDVLLNQSPADRDLILSSLSTGAHA